VGTYLVVGVLGAGGMATVYEAVQENPNRRVALKVMHQGLSHTDAFLRFRLETEALAKLHHPGIAQIYEAGTAPLGQSRPSPFFAMELVPEAVTITQYAEREKLSLRRRLEVFAGVCDAVLHGHQQGIIHRDLKPGNVLVGADGQAKVIDFGIARPTDSAARVTREVDAKRLIGTLNWMSPEQCTTPSDVDVRTDVYSLGVILFELVAGRLPWDLSKYSIPEAVRTIVEKAPPRASEFRAEAKGDLDAIIAKALEKDRTRRYPGAGALAADVRRYLALEPVEARPVGPVQQLVLFARRNRPLAAAIGAGVLTLVAGIAVSVVFAVAAARARDQAESRARDLEVITELQESLLSGLDVRAVGEGMRRSIAESIAGGFRAEADGGAAASADFDRLAARVNFTSVASRTLSEGLLKRYQAAIAARSTDTPRLRARLLTSLATSMVALGQHVEAEPVLREALTLRRAEFGDTHEDTLQSMHALGSVLSSLAQYDEALQLLNAAYEARVAASGKDGQPTLRVAMGLGGVHRRMGNLDEAGRVWGETLAAQRRVLGDDHDDTLKTISNLGIVHAMRGETREAEALWRECLERRRRLIGPDHPDTVAILGNLGVLLQDAGRLDEARPMLEQALASVRQRSGDRNPGTLTSIAQLASVLMDLGELDAAEALERECWEGRKAVLPSDHPDTLYSQAMLGLMMHLRGESAGGWAMISESLTKQRSLLRPGHPQLVSTIGIAAQVASAIAGESGSHAKALELSGEAVRLARESGASPPTLGKLLSQHGGVLLAAARAGSNDEGVLGEARNALREGLQLLEDALGPDHPETRAAARRLAGASTKD
jgi:tetratricopeptide (TPR) repeat protein/tRNA A-37 threonylcarbamoyl transferase component Bud32